MTTEIIPADEVDVGRMPNSGQVEIGQWYWVQDRDGAPWLGCVDELGSNYVHVRGPHDDYDGFHVARVHFDRFWTTLTFEPNPDDHIRKKVAEHQAEAHQALVEVQELTARLGVVPTQQIAHVHEDGAKALAVLSSQADTKAYEAALIEAKKKTLPDLFKRMENANKRMAAWMSAPTIGAMAMVKPLKKTIGLIEDRVFTISLYAGLTEEAVQCCEGEPAPIGEKLRVMQRRLYMDEEALLEYEAGGMEFANIGAFDAWIARPANRDRLLPFPRTAAAFRVRRLDKEREDAVGILRSHINMQMDWQNKQTFLYVRNGEQVWRIDTELQFEELIFPSVTGIENEPMMVKVFGGSCQGEFMPRREFDDRTEEARRKWDANEARRAAWRAENPGADSQAEHMKFGSRRWDERDKVKFDDFYHWEPFDPSSTWYDEALEHWQAIAKQHNRLATIIQGLFDRSPVLHPHPPVQTWTPHGFERAVELIYDGATLTHGEPPDFEAYRARLNASLGPDCIVTGQEDVWLRREGARETAALARSWRRSNDRGPPVYNRYRPDGDPGPGLVSRIEEWKPRTRAAVFRWRAETQRWSAENPDKPESIAVSADQLFNVSGYTPGDYKQFFADPRTRAAYLRWAPLMLAAEDYLAGKIALGAPARH